VLATLGASERRRLGAGRRRRRRVIRTAERESVSTARATLVRADAFPDERAAASWLEALRAERETLTAEVDEAVACLNGVVRAHRAAAADPYAREVRKEHALVRRAGYGEGALVAEGRFAAAVELPVPTSRRRRAERLRPQERLAALLGGREQLLAGEELVLRARLDLDANRPREAALQARIALEALLAELPAEPGRAGPLEELRGARPDVGRAANAALEGELGAAHRATVESAVAAMERALRRRPAGAG
jgi:hypothetical protein